MLFSIVAIPIYIPANSVGGFPSYHTLSSIYCFWIFKKNFYLFMAVLGLRFCTRAFSSCGKWGPLFIAVRRPLIIAASHYRGLSCCRAPAPDAQAQ